MRILLVADLHYALPQFDWVVSVAADFDAVVIAGDLLEIASHVPLDAQIVVAAAYLDRLRDETRLFVCSGNHDLSEQTARGERIAGWLDAAPRGARRDARGAHRLVTDGESSEIGRALVSVLPWWDGPATREAVGAQMARDGQMRHADGPWIWVYHAPPSDCPVSWAGARHYGDRALTAWIERFQPDYVLCGHVHQAPFVPDGAWVSRQSGSWVFNMGQQPGGTPAHIILDTEEKAAAWFSIYGSEIVDLFPDAPAPTPLSDLPGWLRASDRRPR